LLQPTITLNLWKNTEKLGIKHKLKVYDSMKAPDNHEEMALMMVGRWELEDELRAIEDLLADSRQASIANKRSTLERVTAQFPRDALEPREVRRKMAE